MRRGRSFLCRAVARSPMLLREPLAGTTVHTFPDTSGHFPALFPQPSCMSRLARAGARSVPISPYKRGGAGSNPAAPTRFLQLDDLFETLIGNPVTTAGNHRCMLPGRGKRAQQARSSAHEASAFMRPRLSPRPPCALRTLAVLLDAARLAATAKAAGSNRNRALAEGADGRRAIHPADDGLAAAVVIEGRTCPCCCGERPDPGRDTDCRAAARGSTTPSGCRRCIVHHEDLWQLCRDELTGVDVRIDGWDIRGRWFGVVVGATPRPGGCGAARRSHGG